MLTGYTEEENILQCRRIARDIPSIPGMPGYQTKEVELCRSRDDPGIVRVSQDTQTREVESYPSWDDPEMSKYPRKSMYRHARGLISIPGSSWDHTKDVLVT